MYCKGVNEKFEIEDAREFRHLVKGKDPKSINMKVILSPSLPLLSHYD